MEFGKVDDQELKRINFRLPADPQATKETLRGSGKKGKTKFYAGCAKWGRKDWIGKFYPKGTKEKDFLEHYARLFNAIEFNGFFYQQHTADTVRKWKSKVPKGFKFCPKFTQTITHLKRLRQVRQEVDTYLEVLDHFGDSLGPVFLMPHPQMKPDQLDVIRAFIEDLPKDVELFIELRHEDWYKGKEGYNRALSDFLKKEKRGTVITDAAGRRDCVHMHLSIPECFIRFVGNSLHESDYERIDDWIERIAAWVDGGLETCYFFMHQHEELHSPELIRYFIEALNKKVDTGLHVPRLLSQNELF